MIAFDKTNLFCFLGIAAIIAALVFLGLCALGCFDIGLAPPQIMSIFLWVICGALSLISIVFLSWGIKDRDGLFAGIAFACMILCVLTALAALHSDQVLDFFSAKFYRC